MHATNELSTLHTHRDTKPPLIRREVSVHRLGDSHCNTSCDRDGTEDGELDDRVKAPEEAG